MTLDHFVNVTNFRITSILLCLGFICTITGIIAMIVWNIWIVLAVGAGCVAAALGVILLAMTLDEWRNP